MNAQVRPSSSAWPPEACSGLLPEVLERIREPQFGLAVWLRRVRAAIPAWVERNVHPLRGGCRFTITEPSDGEQRLDQALGDSRIVTTGADGAAWRRDLLSLLALAWRIAPQSPALRVRIERCEDDSCRLFHVDRTALRLICTYLGPGTQWLPEGAFVRGALGCGCNNHVRDWTVLQQLAPGQVAVMKGEGYRGNAGRGLVHRSPPASPRHPRVVLVVDFG